MWGLDWLRGEGVCWVVEPCVTAYGCRAIVVLVIDMLGKQGHVKDHTFGVFD